MPGCGEQKHSTDMRIQGHTEVREQVSGNSTEQYGGGTQRSPGSIFVPRRRQDIRLPSCGDAPEYTEESTFQMQKDCKAESMEIPKNIMAKDPVTHMLTHRSIYEM